MLALLLAASEFHVDLRARVDARAVYRSESVEDAWFALTHRGAALPREDRGWLSVRALAGADVSWGDFEGAVALEAVPARDGDWLHAGEDPGALLREAWIEARAIGLRAGIQPYEFQLRPPGLGEPMFLAPSESDSAWRPAVRTATDSDRSNGMRGSARPDFLNPAGLRWRHEFNPFVMTEAIAFRVADDEYLAGALVDAAGDRISLFLLAAYLRGPWAGAHVGTIGIGADWYADEARTWELFAEAYLQFGVYTDRADRTIAKSNAFAIEAGVRHTMGDWWIEVAHAAVSGDRSPNDNHDGAFQSYENVNRFLVLQDSTFGLDLENGYRSWRAGAGWGLAPSQQALTARVDVGVFDLEQPLRDRAGAALTARDSLGVEVDLTAAWRVHECVTLQLRSGWLWDSAALEDLSGERDGGAVTLGPVITW